jgi:hypothetical protein
MSERLQILGDLPLLRAWADQRADSTHPVPLVADFYELLGELGVAAWDADDPMISSRLGTLA